jgi:UDP-N-acetylmuramoyl-L-alanyl-D-glutamate--2,6-diaminopimelate ligase
LLKKAIGRDLPATIADFPVAGITADSRQVREGFVFVAVAGTQTDGADYAKQAVEKGARLVVSHRPIDGVSAVVVVEQANLALAKLAWTFYGIDDLQSQGKLTIYGVTGTNGKTTFCYLFQYLANKLGRRCARFGTVEYDLLTEKVEASHTTPDTMQLASLIRRACDNGADSIVMEVSSHALDQGRAAGLIFSHGAFTNLTGDHLDYHKTMENYLAAKLILFKSLPANGSSVVNADDPSAMKVLDASKTRHITYGIENPKASLVARDLKMTSAGTTGVFEFEGKKLNFHSPFIGKHNVSNVLAAVGMGLGAGFDFKAMVDLIPTMSGAPGRLERVPNRCGFEVFVDYAHTDDGLVNVLSSLKPLVTNKLIVVFGCGGDRDRTKRPRMAKVAQNYGDVVIVTSDNPRTENPDAIIEEIMTGFTPEFRPRVRVEADRTKAIGLAVELASAGDIILLAGKGHETYQIIGKEKIHFDDREKVAEFMSQKKAAR